MTEPLVHQAYKVVLAYKGLLEPLVTWVISVLLALQVYKDLKAQQVFKVKLVPLVRVD
jgi:hypothetical protein